MNGTEVVNPVQLHHGDRILWGNNHFFRCVFEPGSAASYFSHQHLLHVVTNCFSSSLSGSLFPLCESTHEHRINLPRHKVQKGGEDEEGAAMTKCSSSDCLEVGELDAYSDVSSERSFGYEFAQAEVMMKGVWNNGESE